MTLLLGLRVYEFQPVNAEPGDFGLVFVEICLTQNRVVRPAIKVHNNAMTGFNFDSTRRRHKLSLHALRFALIEAVELAGKPAIATIRQHCQHRIQIHVQPNFARQTVLMKEVYAASQSVLDFGFLHRFPLRPAA